jgi:putative flippase GtrA
MSPGDFDSRLRQIDKALESISDDQLLPAPAKGAPVAEKAAVAEQRAQVRTWPAFLRLGLASALAVGMVFWPYASRCGGGLAAYLGAVVAVVVAGGWSAVWTWRHRTARAHLLSLLLVLWGLVLAAIEVLPRTGYAVPTAAHPAAWACVP